MNERLCSYRWERFYNLRNFKPNFERSLNETNIDKEMEQFIAESENTHI